MSAISELIIINFVYFIICLIPGLSILICNPLGLTILFIINNIYFMKILSNFFKEDPKKRMNEQLEKSKEELKKKDDAKPKNTLPITKAPYGKVGHISEKDCMNKTKTKDCSKKVGLWYAKCKDGYSEDGLICRPS